MATVDITSSDDLTTITVKPKTRGKRNKRTDRPMLLYLNETDHSILSQGAEFYKCSKHDVVRKFLHSFRDQLNARQYKGV